MSNFQGNMGRVKILPVLQKIVQETLKEVYTAIPAHILNFDPEKQLAQIELGIERVDLDGTRWTPPPIIETPVLFTGDQYSLEFEIHNGCEGLAVFSQRCIDAWVQTGGVATNPLRRFFDIQDAFFIPGFRPMTNLLKDFKNNGIRLRSPDNAKYVWIKNTGDIEAANDNGKVSIANNGAITLSNGGGSIVLDASGRVTINGLTITADGKLTDSGGISLDTHVHSGVESGGSNTGAPV